MKTDDLKRKKTRRVLFCTDQLNRIGNDDRTFTRQMLIKFAYQVSICSGKIKDAVMRNDWMNLKLITHKNIPAYSIMNSSEAVGLLKYIESNAGIASEHNRIRSKAARVCKMNDRILMAIIDHLQMDRKKVAVNRYEYLES